MTIQNSTASSGDGLFEASEELKLGRKLQSRLRGFVFIDEYEARDQIREFATAHSVPLWQAAQEVERDILSEYGFSTEDIPISKREPMDYESHAEGGAFDSDGSNTPVDGFWIPHAEESIRQGGIEQAENELLESKPSETNDGVRSDILTDVEDFTENPPPPRPLTQTGNGGFTNSAETIGELFNISHWGDDTNKPLGEREYEHINWPGLYYFPSKVNTLVTSELSASGLKRGSITTIYMAKDLSIAFIALVVALGLLSVAVGVPVYIYLLIVAALI